MSSDHERTVRGAGLRVTRPPAVLSALHDHPQASHAVLAVVRLEHGEASHQAVHDAGSEISEAGATCSGRCPERAAATTPDS